MNLHFVTQNRALISALIAAALGLPLVGAAESQSSGQSQISTTASPTPLLAAAFLAPARRDGRDDYHDDDAKFFTDDRLWDLISGSQFGGLATVLSVLGAGLGVVWRGFLIAREWRRPGSTDAGDEA